MNIYEIILEILLSYEGFALDLKNLQNYQKITQKLEIKNDWDDLTALPIYNFRFRAYGRVFNLHLQTNHDIFSETVDLPPNIVVDKNNLLIGSIKGERSSWVNGYLDREMFIGTIYSAEDNMSYFLDRAYERDSLPYAVIYREIDINVSQSENNQPIQPILEYQDSLSKISGKGVNKICNVFLEVDISYSDYYGGVTYGVYHAMSRLAEASWILKNSILSNKKNTPDDYVIRIKKIRANDSSQDRPSMFRDQVLDADDIMIKFASLDFRDYCLAFLFVSKPFKAGVAGAAYAAKEDDGSGGICSGRLYYDMGGYGLFLNLNVIMITNIYHQTAMYGYQEVRNILHEIGHAFGSTHDPSELSECTPSYSEGGPYIMYPNTPNSVFRNTFIFSPCSKEKIEHILKMKAHKCFTDTENLCGNLIIDEGEECDCGEFDVFCQDRCCNSPSHTEQCQLSRGSVCSPQQGLCCNPALCSYYQLGYVCHKETFCSRASYCKGNSSTCPPPTYKNQGSMCNNYGNVCQNATCSGSPCSLINTTQCSCEGIEDIDNQCLLCCIDPRTKICRQSKYYHMLPSKYLTPGSTCGKGSLYGYCNEEGFCIININDQNFENRMKLKSISILFQQYFMIVLIISFGITVISTALYLTIKYVKKVRYLRMAPRT